MRYGLCSRPGLCAVQSHALHSWNAAVHYVDYSTDMERTARSIERTSLFVSASKTSLWQTDRWKITDRTTCTAAAIKISIAEIIWETILLLLLVLQSSTDCIVLQPVPVKFNCDLSKGLANILDAPSGSQEVKELPFWLARSVRTLPLAGLIRIWPLSSVPVTFRNTILCLDFLLLIQPYPQIVLHKVSGFCLPVQAASNL